MPALITASQLRERFKLVDTEFNNQIKKNNKVSAEYGSIASKYDELLTLISDVNQLNVDLESSQRKCFELKARLGSLQCRMNSLEVSPVDETVIQQNDATLFSLAQELAKIESTAKEVAGLSKKSFPKTFGTFRSNLKLTRKNWSKNTQKLQAAYYYNFGDYFANFIVDGIKKSHKLSTLSKKTEKAIKYLEKAASLYRQNGMSVSEKQTESRITEVKKPLEQLLNLSDWTVSLKREEKAQKAKLSGLITSSTQETENPKPEPAIVKIERTEKLDESLPRHKIDNNLPILQDPENPSHSLLSEAEVPIDELKVSHWGVLNERFKILKIKEVKKIQENIYKEIREWLRSEGQHEEKFNEFLGQPAIPIDDGPYRGMSVFAKRDIPSFKVVGPYSGKFLRDSEVLNREYNRAGKHNVVTYLFGTRSKNRAVSAFGSGNILSLINTADPLRLSSEHANESLEVCGKHNNVAAIQVGKNLTFYVALENISKDTELLVSYGPVYDPMQEQTTQDTSRLETSKLDVPVKNIHSVDQSNCSVIQEENEINRNSTIISSPEISLSLNAITHDDSSDISPDPQRVAVVNTPTKRRYSALPSFTAENSRDNTSKKSKLDLGMEDKYLKLAKEILQSIETSLEIKSSTDYESSESLCNEVHNIIEKFKEIYGTVEKYIEKSVETHTVNHFTDYLNKLSLTSCDNFQRFLNTLSDFSTTQNSAKSEGKEGHISIGQTIQLSYATLLKELTESFSTVNNIPGTIFFKPTVSTSKETLIETLGLGLIAIKNKYKIPCATFLVVYKNLLCIIGNQFDQCNINANTIIIRP